VKVIFALTILRGSHARHGVAYEAQRTHSADLSSLLHRWVPVLVLCCDVRKPYVVALPGGTALLIPGVVIVVLLEPVQQTCPRRRGLLGHNVQRSNLRVFPLPIFLHGAEPVLHLSHIEIRTAI